MCTPRGGTIMKTESCLSRGWSDFVVLTARALRVHAAPFTRSHGIAPRAGVHLRLARHAVLNLVRHGHESPFDVRGVLRRSFYERDTDLIRERLRRRVIHHLLTRQIALISHQ